MRIDTRAIHMKLSPAQREYARARLWSATRRAAGRLAWAGMWLAEATGAPGEAAVVCRATAWIHGIGAVSTAHVAGDAFVAIDLAAARLEQALSRATRAAAMRRRAFAPVQAALQRGRGRRQRPARAPRKRQVSRRRARPAVAGATAGTRPERPVAITHD